MKQYVQLFITDHRFDVIPEMYDVSVFLVRVHSAFRPCRNARLLLRYSVRMFLFFFFRIFPVSLYLRCTLHDIMNLLGTGIYAIARIFFNSDVFFFFFFYTYIRYIIRYYSGENKSLYKTENDVLNRITGSIINKTRKI